MSTYSSLDSAIEAWKTKHSVEMATAYRDDEVRSTWLQDSKGNRFQIWIDPPGESEVVVHAWDYKQTRRAWKVPIAQLNNALDEAIQTVRTWMQQA